MKKITAIISVHLWLIFLCFSINAQEFKTIQNGIEYAEMTRESDNTTVKINLLRLDLTKVRLDVVHALDAAIGTELTSSMAKRHGAIAAINSGFFRLDRSIFAGENVSSLMIDGKLLSEGKNRRVALRINNNENKTSVDISRIDAYPSLAGYGKDLIVSGVNRELKDDELVLFTPEFSRTTLTDFNSSELIVENNKVVKIVNSGSNVIPKNGFILSASGKRREDLSKYFKIRGTVSVGFQMLSVKTAADGEILSLSDNFTVEDIVSGVPQLIKNGKIEITWQEEKSSKDFVETRHPRTAVAKLKDGKFLMITVDGRSESSGGIRLDDLAELLLKLGAIDAMNLDGGGSTTMFLDGKVVNKPSDKEGERKVGDAILVFPRKK